MPRLADWQSSDFTLCFSGQQRQLQLHRVCCMLLVGRAAVVLMSLLPVCMRCMTCSCGSVSSSFIAGTIFQSAMQVDAGRVEELASEPTDIDAEE